MKVKSIILIVVMFLLCPLLLINMGCGGDDGGGSGDDGYDPCDIDDNVYAPTKVKWWIDDQGTLHWDNAAKSSEYQSGNDYNITVVWYCADYEGQENKYVDLSFWDWDGDGQGWILEDEYVSTGICEEECL